MKSINKISAKTFWIYFGYGLGSKQNQFHWFIPWYAPVYTKFKSLVFWHI